MRLHLNFVAHCKFGNANFEDFYKLHEDIDNCLQMSCNSFKKPTFKKMYYFYFINPENINCLIFNILVFNENVQIDIIIF